MVKKNANCKRLIQDRSEYRNKGTNTERYGLAEYDLPELVSLSGTFSRRENTTGQKRTATTGLLEAGR